MDVKSRYEVIADLEEKKRELILKKDGLDETLRQKKKQVKHLKRQLEDLEEDVEAFENSMNDQKNTLDTLIESTNDSLNRFHNVKSGSESQKK